MPTIEIPCSQRTELRPWRLPNQGFRQSHQRRNELRTDSATWLRTICISKIEDNSPVHLPFRSHRTGPDQRWEYWNTAKAAVDIVRFANLSVTKAMGSVRELHRDERPSFEPAQLRSIVDQVSNKRISDAERKKLVQDDPLIMPAN